MVDLTQGPDRPMGWGGRIGDGQRAFWLAYDVGLLSLTVIAMADMPQRWGVGGLVWLLVYLLFILRVTMIWPDYFRLLSRNWTLLLFATVCLISVVWSGSRATTMAAGTQMMMSTLIAVYVGWRFSPKQLIIGIFLIVSAGSALSLVNMVVGFVQPVYSAVGGLLGIYTNKNTLGHYSQMAALMSLTVLLMRPGEVPRLLRLYAPFAFAICAFAMVMSKSMTAVLLLPCYTGLFLLINRRRLPVSLRYGTIGLLIVLIGAGPFVLALMGIDPLTEIFRATGKDPTLTGRTDLWGIGLGVAAQSPLTGFGFGAFWAMDRFAPEQFAVVQAGSPAPSFHNFMIDILVGTGAIGLACNLTLLGTVLWRTLRFYLATGWALASGCLVLTLLPLNVGLVETYLFRQHEFMLMWLIMIGVSVKCHAPPFVNPSSRNLAGDLSQVND
ncbi:O-antigen ligase family protein [Paracoccus shanxieyensis]|uniref:O-antigen ligase-related domain-containing protein n=1 Tax=Paracoccus shanxieyensis TaxID=2675752 RepID=A0A6L6IXZ1_9RHOB|nr:O-antigen ligase family protein [Paracoccus shanxieyensis]MTH64471.1 hypothetical protein [Paracoccus shanxieyensis]MTH87536.1 hypothetical protein [Paracoccus shanxieyensis]